MPSIRKTLVAALMAFPAAMGHSWGEQLRNIDDKGNYVGQYGYPRGFIDRPDGTDDPMSYQIPQGRAYINKDDLLCPDDQREQKQSADKWPRLKAPPGGYVAIRYQENGHVTRPENNPEKPDKGGTIFVYGTKEPKGDEKLVDVLQWTKDGQGGDKRGVLLAMTDYDDGRCYLNNKTPVASEREKFSPAYAMGTPQSGPSNTVMYCETDVKLPDTMELSKTYTLYWVWQWASIPGKAGKQPNGLDEYYTTCMDIDAASPDVAMAAEAPEAMAKFQMQQQDAGTAAHPDWKSRTALFTDSPFKREYGPVTSEITLPGGGSGSGGAPFPTNSTPPAGPTAPVTTSAIPAPSAAPPAASNSPSISAVVPSATAQLPSPSNSAASSATIEIPTLSGRPGAAPTPPAGNNGVVTVTDTVMVTVTAPAPTAPVATPPAPPAITPPAVPAPAITPRAVHSIYHRNGAKFRGL